jgi:hypothetical protein
MTPIQIVCAVLAQLLGGYQYVVIKIGVAELPWNYGRRDNYCEGLYRFYA